MNRNWSFGAGLASWIRWHATCAMGRFDAAQQLALAASVFACGLLLAVVLPLQDEVHQLQQQTVVAAKRAARQAPVVASVAPVKRISDEFIEFLPDESTRSDQLTALHELLQQSQLVLARVDYRIGPLKALPVDRVSINLQVQGAYLAQRQFLRNLLNSMPNLAVDRLTLEKNPGPADSLTQRIEASLYYRRGPVAHVAQ